MYKFSPFTILLNNFCFVWKKMDNFSNELNCNLTKTTATKYMFTAWKKKRKKNLQPNMGKSKILVLFFYLLLLLITPPPRSGLVEQITENIAFKISRSGRVVTLK